ncbi:undecaprenyl-diphosphate phosphatase [Sediminivirga luteola]|uniref:Undecaprenyl-diphosphatase n=1 Tax=Sediminivirga luteola TaxID=1774748 RepID=A0A8J2TWK7_9MICO|nr:undecaprenyl-diphosphate phosphatase [Sediminivirga luteola]GGA08678.1 undecaprenyl-diphosphatase 2 [Sediminivirga luteola]
MEWLTAIVLGIVQGLTEFLPVSSSAHVRIVGELMLPGNDPGAFFTAIVQLGTETAVLVYFWKDIRRIVTAWFGWVARKRPASDPDVRMGWFIIVGTIPIVVLGLLFEDSIDSVFRSLWIVATMLIVFGLALGLADKFSRKERSLQQLTWKHGIIYGFGQALALVPGVSRSGGTITTGLVLGYTRQSAAYYSFLLALPAVFGSGFFGLYRSIGEPMVLGWGPTIAATAVSFVVGYVVIVAFLKYISSHSYWIFVWYRVGLGILLFILLGTGVLQPL